MKGIKRYYILFITTVLAVVACQQKEMKLPSLKETYGKEDKKPFGGYVAFQQVKEIFADNYIQSTYEPFTDTWNGNFKTDDEKQSLYILITKDLFLSDTDAEEIAEYVKGGNDMFISADFIDVDLLTEVGFNTEREDEVKSEINGIMRTTSAKISNIASGDSMNYKFYYFPLQNYFTGFDFEYTRPLGWNENGRPNFIVMFIGSGRLYLHAAPRTFSNYFLLTQQNHKYLEQILGYVRKEPKYVYWDEYYKYHALSHRKERNNTGSSGNGSGGGSGSGRSSRSEKGGGKDAEKKNSFSSFNVINEHEELKWAFWLGIISLLLFALFNMKRKQRIVPKADPNVNTTVAFTETVGRLYLQKKNNKNISDKMITYLFEHIRKHYFLSTTNLGYDFNIALSRKSGIPIEQIETLFHTVSSVQSSKTVEDFQLLSLNEQVQNFYKIKN